jgi:putative ABC transport system ATP-binding protein
MLKITNLSKVFGEGTTNEHLALNNLNLTLGDGEFVTVIGDNGAGKTTLLNCISGVYEIDQGNIRLDNMDITFWPEHKRSRHLGRVFQDPLLGTAFDMTIEENLAMAYAKGKPRGLRPGVSKTERKFLRDCLAQLQLGLENRMEHKVGLLSGGQRQALTLLMATIVKPRLLLLDEHTAALDPSIAAKVLQLTKQIVAENQLCTLMVTHNMKAALDFGSRTIMMHDGSIILDIKGQERRDMTVDRLIEQFGRRSGTEFDNDRMLLG